MKKQILIFILISSLCFLTIISNAQTPNWLWAKSAGGSLYDEAKSVAIDASGNIYVAGWFGSSSITFGSYTLTSSGSDNIFIVKYDPKGNVLWAKSPSGTGGILAYSIAVDGLGNSYVVGYFDSYSITFGSTTLTNAGYTDIFIAKYDTNGNVLWAKSAGGTNLDNATSVTVDDSGNSYIAGYFYSSTIVFSSKTLTNTTNGNCSNIFLAKYDANGVVLWAKNAGGTNGGNAVGASSVKVDAAGNSYLVGYFDRSTIFFGSKTLTNMNTNGNSTDIFLAKYDTNGNVLWAKSAGGTNDDVANSVTLDASGNTYVAGGFQSPNISFGSTTLTNTNTNGTNKDFFLAKYDPNGNVLWAKSAGGTNVFGEANSVALDASGNIYMAGWFGSSTITFDTITLTLTKGGADNIFIAKYDINGNVLWARSASGTGNHGDIASSVAVNTSGNAYVVGYFDNPTITFDSITLTSNGGYDLFLAKLASFAVNIKTTKVSCYGGNNGTATANAYGGGISPFTYLWNTYPIQTKQTATGLEAGNYIITVSDAMGSTSQVGVTITQPLQINISTTKNTFICKGKDTKICVSVQGGTSPYQYLWSNNSTSSCQTVSPIIATTYTATITDANECKATSSFIIVKVDTASKPIITLNGKILFSTAGSTYQWNLNGNPIEGATGQFYAPLTPGVYSVTVTYTNGCSATSDGFNIAGINSFIENQKLKIYPNPANDIVTIDFQGYSGKDKTMIELYSITGGLLKMLQVQNTLIEVNISDLPKGVYIIKVINDISVVVKRVVKE